jgi:hypothetical protein
MKGQKKGASHHGAPFSFLPLQIKAPEYYKGNTFRAIPPPLAHPE